ncbi:hypothetical protein FS837_005377 [Tulasnella sp. UAMH 9824]|nr:hypothetical protein FS837_005377 [Tulasnella sp. UAMH 9824]
MSDETPSTQGLLKAASSDIRQEIVIEDAFPERAVFTEQCKATFLAAWTCGSMQAAVHRQRFLKSDSYRVRVLHILRQKLPQLRQEVRNAALATTAIHCGIPSKMNPADIAELVDHLKTSYVFEKGAIWEPRIPDYD